MTNAEAILPAIDAAKADGAGGLNVLAASLFGGNAKMIIEHTTALRLPSIYMWPNYADDGALIAYGPVQSEVYRQVARGSVQILGERNAHLPPFLLALAGLRAFVRRLLSPAIRHSRGFPSDSPQQPGVNQNEGR